MSVNPGELHHTTRGIAEIHSFYRENGIDKVRFYLHTVDENDGVTPNGEAILMSTVPEKLQAWIDRFPHDMQERKRTVSALKDFRPELAEKVDGILARIQEAQADGPKVDPRQEAEKGIAP